MASIGTIITFYLFKGGVGRSMALANVAALLAKWRKRVLIVDWDLEAPGIEAYFSKYSTRVRQKRKERPGIIDWVKTAADKERISWRNCLIQIKPFSDGLPLNIITAGRNDSEYVGKVQSIDWEEEFCRNHLGSALENLRTEWKKRFDFILIDSRTGITDIGGICTVHLPDVLVGMFTSNRASVDGIKDVVSRARKAQNRLPFDRIKLLAVPVPARDESKSEHERANVWHRVFRDELGPLCDDWIPADSSYMEIIELIKIPYTNGHYSEPIRPLPPSDGHDFPRLIDEFVPGVAT